MRLIEGRRTPLSVSVTRRARRSFGFGTRRARLACLEVVEHGDKARLVLIGMRVLIVLLRLARRPYE